MGTAPPASETEPAPVDPPGTTDEPEANDTPEATDEPPASDPAPPASPEPDSGEGSSLLGRGRFSFVALQAPEGEDDAPADPPAGEDPAETTEPAPPAEDPTDEAPANLPTAEQPPTAPPATADPPAEASVPATGTPRASIAGMTKATLEFGHPQSEASVRALLQAAVDDLYGHIDMPALRVDNPNWNKKSPTPFKQWHVEIPLNETAARRVFDRLQEQTNDTPVWLSSNKIGPQVAGNLREKAIVALVVSMLGIVAYIWLRFQHLTFGLAAIVALVHDVLITLGAVAASLWLSYAFGWLLMDDFKINLTVVAALLTVVGYSINDTIVVFDRLREVRGKNPDMTTKMVNDSCNQTLQRTMLTGVTSLMVLVILYVLGGESIRGFAFALLVGILVGTYSSIFIASPFVLWMMSKPKTKAEKTEKAKALV
jgi:SecD/SecF fusion protein